MRVDFRGGMMPIDEFEKLFREQDFYPVNTQHLLRVYSERVSPNEKNENEESEVAKYELSKEFYTVVGLANLEKEPDYPQGTDGKTKMNKSDRVRMLQKIDLYNEKLIEIRKLLYEEIKRSIARDKDEAAFYTDDTIYEVQQIVYDTFKILLKNDKNEFPKLNRNIERIGRYADAVQSGPRRNFLIKLLHALIDCSFDSSRGKVEYYESLIAAVELVDNSGYFRYSNRIWGVCLLTFFDDFVSDNSEYVDLVDDFDSSNYSFDNLSAYYVTCDNYLLESQLSANMTLTCLYQVSAYPSGVFYKEKVVQDIQKVLKKSKTLKASYGDMKIMGNTYTKGKKNGSGCFAIMTVGDKKYATLSGLSSKRANEFHILSTLLSKDYQIVKKEGAYYLDNGWTMDFASFASSPFLSGQERKLISDGDYDRMFSCCERKFVTKMQAYTYHKIFVKYAPCYMCERMITEEESKYSCMIEVICPISKKYSVPRENEYDNMAKRAMGLIP